MPRKRILVLTDPDDAKAVDTALCSSRDDLFEVEWAGLCGDAIERLTGPGGETISGVVTGLDLPDSRGLETFERLVRASPRQPILVIGRSGEEEVARQAVRRGAQDYLLLERLDGYTLHKAVTSMLDRACHAAVSSAASARARLTLDSIGDAVVSTDASGCITYLNPVAARMTGWSLQEAAGRPLQNVVRIIDAESRKPVPNPLAMAMLQDETVGLGANCLLVRRDGHESAIEDTAAPMRDPRGRVTGAVIVFRDVGAAREMSQRMSHLAQHDTLTGLPNRLLLRDRLNRAVEAARRHGHLVAVLFMDLDGFKRVNDSLGHAAGDLVLQSVARRIAAGVRSSDTVSREGGDEFVVLLSEVARAEDAALSAGKLLAAIALPHHVGAQDLRVTASVGIALFPADGADAALLLGRADRALLHAKARARGRAVAFRPALEQDKPRKQAAA